MKTQTGKPVTIIWLSFCVSSDTLMNFISFRSCNEFAHIDRLLGIFGFVVVVYSLLAKCSRVSSMKIFLRCCTKSSNENTTRRLKSWLWSTESLGEKKEAKAQSEQQNRRKFLFILFVIISFLHYEYLKFFLFLLYTSYSPFIFHQKTLFFFSFFFWLKS